MANGIASALGNILGSIVSTSFGGGGGTNVGDSANLMTHQANLWKDNTKWYNENILAHAYKLTRSSLEEAGYNPLMALNNGALTGQGPMPNAIATQNEKTTTIGRLASAQESNIRADTLLKKAQEQETMSSAKLKNQMKETEIMKTNLTYTQNEISKVEREIQQGNLNWQEREKQINYRNMLINTEATQKQATASLMNAMAAQSNASANQEIKDIELQERKLEIDKARRYYNWGNKNKILRDIDETINRHKGTIKI